MGILHRVITNPNYRGIEANLYPDAYRRMDKAPEGYCETCDSFTTNYNHRGECRECGTEVREGVEEE